MQPFWQGLVFPPLLVLLTNKHCEGIQIANIQREPVGEEHTTGVYNICGTNSIDNSLKVVNASNIKSSKN